MYTENTKKKLNVYIAENKYLHGYPHCDLK